MEATDKNPHKLCNQKYRCVAEDGDTLIEYYIQIDYVQHTKDGLKAYANALWIRIQNTWTNEYQYDMFLEPFAYDLNEFQIYNQDSTKPTFEIISDAEWDKVVNNEIIAHYKQMGLEEVIDNHFKKGEDDNI